MIRLIECRAADLLCFGRYWAGSIRRLLNLGYLAHLEGQQVCKHTHGELGIAAAAAHHAALCLPGLMDGNQQTAARVELWITRCREFSQITTAQQQQCFPYELLL